MLLLRAAPAISLALALVAVRLRARQRAQRRDVDQPGSEKFEFPDSCLPVVARYLSLPELVRLGVVSKQLKRLVDKEVALRRQFNDALEGTRASDAFLATLASRCPRIESLSISSKSKISDAGLSALAQCNSLTRLCIADQANVTDCGLEFLIDSRIVELSLSNLRQVTEKSLTQAVRVKVLALERMRINLEVLHHRTTLLSPQLVSLSLLSFTRVDAALLKDCTNLRFLNLSSSTFDHGGGFQVPCASLEKFSANYALDLTDADCAKILEQNRQSLRAISLNGAEFISDVTLEAMSGDIIEHVNVSQTCISSTGLVSMAARCSSLGTLYFGGTLVDDSCLEQLATVATGLTVLGISHCPLITRHRLLALLDSGSFPCLRRLSSSFDLASSTSRTNIVFSKTWV